uniref:uncharacterized protein LOC120345047 n=1 Tax=Styela clava TaxID=7725 RepID=UPI00193AC8DF|nr:uncharacterized protein LOC120345047 [Styela clava]
MTVSNCLIPLVIILSILCVPSHANVLRQRPNDWPTYQHEASTTYRVQLCFKCPPGFFMVEQCEFTRDTSKNPGQSVCLPCPSGQFSQRWNTDGHCWDHDTCSNDQDQIYSGGSTGPTKCVCGPSKLVENGRCIDGISKTKHDSLMNKQKMEYLVKLNEQSLRHLRAISTKTTTTTTMKAITEGTTVEAPLEVPCRRDDGISLSEIEVSPAVKEESNSSTVLFVVLCVALIIIITILTVMLTFKHKQCNELQKDGEKKLLDKGAYQKVSEGSRGSDSREDITPTDSKTSVQKSAKKIEHIIEGDLKVEDEISPKNKTNEEQGETKHLDIVDGLPNLMGKADREQAQDTNVVRGVDVKDKWDEVSRIFEHRILTKDDRYLLSRHVLQLHTDILNKINNMGIDRAAKIREAVKWFKESKPVDATLFNVLASLRRHNFNRIADEIVQELGFTENKENHKIDRLDRAFAIVEWKMPPERARNFCVEYLKLNQTQIKKIEQGKSNLYMRDGLALWRSQNIKPATLEDLLEYLVESNNADIADIICKEFGMEWTEAMKNARIIAVEHHHAEESQKDNKAGPIHDGITISGPTRETADPRPPSTDTVVPPQGEAADGFRYPEPIAGPSTEPNDNGAVRETVQSLQPHGGTGAQPEIGASGGLPFPEPVSGPITEPNYNGAVEETVQPRQPLDDTEVPPQSRAFDRPHCSESIPGPSTDPNDGGAGEAQGGRLMPDSAAKSEDDKEIMDIDVDDDKPDHGGKASVEDESYGQNDSFEEHKKTSKSSGARPIVDEHEEESSTNSE